MLAALAPHASGLHLTPVSSPRSRDPEAYADRARARCGYVANHPSVPQALAAARARAGPSGVVVCAGSLLLVAEVLADCGAGTHP